MTAKRTLKSLSKNRSDMFFIDPMEIKVKPGLNTRILTSPEAIEGLHELAKSIISEGVRQPVKVFAEGNDYFLSDGHRRMAAITIAIEEYGAEIDRVPVLVEPRGTNDMDRLFSQITLNSGVQFTSFEQGRLFARLTAMGMSVEEIVRRSGKSTAHVYNCLKVQEASEDVKQSIANGEISHSAALDVIREHGDNASAVIKEAKNKAKENGRTKATARDISSTVVKPQKMTVKRLFEDHANDIIESKIDGNEGMFIPMHVYERIRNILDF